jgi:hypothetical protein
MNKGLSKIAHFILTAFLLSAIFVIPVTLAQDFAPPTVLPSDDTQIEGYGDACINLADRIRTGDIQLRQIPCFIKYFSQTLIALAGTLSVIFVMVGGYRYVLGSDAEKDKAKNTILYSLIGLAVTLLAWVMVDTVLQFFTE